jgi:glycosyltransferase involved in cell wall biosynthesis
MNICIVIDRIPPEGRGGAERVAWQSAQALTKKGHQVSVITATSRALVDVEEKNIEGVRVFYIHSKYAERWRSWRSLYNPAAVRAVKRIFNEVEPEIVHAHNVHFDLSYHVLRLAKKSGARVFLTAHDVMFFTYGKLYEFVDPKHPICKKGWDYHVSVWQKIKRFKWRYNPFRNSIIRWYLRNVGVFFSVSEALRQALLQNGMPEARVLYTGIDASQWQLSQEKATMFKEKFQLIGRKIIFFGGRLNAAKGGAQLLEALRQTVSQVPSALLLIAGARDAYVEKLLEKARQWGIEKNIMCTGWLEGDELRAAYHSADVIALPSVCFDSFPLTVLEGMACSKPVIATCFGGSQEMVEDGKTGYVINPYDIPLFAGKLIDILTDAQKRDSFGKVGYEHVRNLFSLDRHVAQLEEYYRQ